MANKGKKLKQFCSNGHNTFVCGRDSQHHCKQCKRDINIAWADKNKESLIEIKKQWHQDNKERILADKKKHYEANKEEILIKHRQYQKDHPEIMRLHSLKHKTTRGLRIVAWSDIKNINEFERNKPKGMTTDHYIPLQGKLVAGLHVSWNLQYLPKLKNASKINKIDLTEASEWYGKLLEEAGLK